MDRVAGIDVGKASLDVSLVGGPVRQFANTAEGRRPLLQWLGQEDVTRAVCEPTGGYERALVACSDRCLGRRSGPIRPTNGWLAVLRPASGRSTPAYAVAERSASNRFANPNNRQSRLRFFARPRYRTVA